MTDTQQIKDAFKISSAVVIKNFTRVPERATLAVGTAIAVSRPVIPEGRPDFTIQNGPTPDKALYSSSLGTPVFADLTFLAGQYETNTPGVVKSFETFTIATVLITVNQAKKVVRTEIQGRDGTVKEYIGMDDYELNINLVLTGSNGVRPVDDIAALKRIVDAPIAVAVASAYLQALGIDQIVILSCEWGQDEGSYSYQTVAISAISDVPQELRLTNV